MRNLKEKNKHFLTANGLAELEAELSKLKLEKRPEVVKNLKEAKALGDLSENAEYDSARAEQAEIEGRIKELEIILDNHLLVPEGDGKTVNIGSRVKLLYVAEKEEEEYLIVGKTEADPFENKISNESDIAKAIIGKKVGDEVTVNSKAGSYKLKIKKILK